MGTSLGLLGLGVVGSSAAAASHRTALGEPGPQTVQLHAPQPWGRGAAASGWVLQQKELSSGPLSHPKSQQVTCHLCPPPAQETSQSLVRAPQLFARGSGTKAAAAARFCVVKLRRPDAALLPAEQTAAPQGPRALRLPG